MEVEHQTYFVVQNYNLVFDKSNLNKRLQLQQLEKLHLYAYKKHKDYY